MEIRWERVPTEFHYLRRAVEACGETRVSEFDPIEGRHIAFFERASADQLQVLQQTKNVIERREDRHPIEQWCSQAESGRSSEKTAAWYIRGILLLLVAEL
ncbi:MAG: hypothetical protein CMJ64_18725 [Planctomycetaceae bacterium]|nr:hypothetical protein [Planctomycetaceae bacterium]